MKSVAARSCVVRMDPLRNMMSVNGVMNLQFWAQVFASRDNQSAISMWLLQVAAHMLKCIWKISKQRYAMMRDLANAYSSVFG